VRARKLPLAETGALLRFSICERQVLQYIKHTFIILKLEAAQHAAQQQQLLIKFISRTAEAIMEFLQPQRAHSEYIRSQHTRARPEMRSLCECVRAARIYMGLPRVHQQAKLKILLPPPRQQIPAYRRAQAENKKFNVPLTFSTRSF
jgi:hypothetical protein